MLTHLEQQCDMHTSDAYQVYPATDIQPLVFIQQFLLRRYICHLLTKPTKENYPVSDRADDYWPRWH